MKFLTGLPLIVLHLLFSLVWGQQTASPQAEQKPGSIEGVVLLETTQEPVRRVEMTAMLARPATPPQAGQSGGGGQAGFGQPPEQFQAVTDAQGKFKFTNLQPGMYFLNLRRQGFVVPRRSAFASRNQVTLGAGQDVSGLKFSLLPQAIIAGRVIDDEGEPLQGARVTAMNSRTMNGKVSWMPVGQGAQTNDKGEFRLTDLPSGKFLVSVSLQQIQPMGDTSKSAQPAFGYVTTYYPSAASPAQATTVTLTAGQELAGTDVSLKKAPVFSVRGKALDLEGQPLKDFYPTLQSRDMPFMQGPFQSMRPSQDGTFSISGVPSGSYILRLNVMNRITQGNQTAQFMGRQSITVPLEVGNSDVNDIVARLEPPFQFTGTIKVDGDGEKPSLANVNVMLAANEPMMMSGPMQARTRDDGTFSIDVQSRGRFRLQAFGPNLRNSYLAAIRIGSEDYLGKDIDLTAGATGPVQIIFRTDAAQVSGTVESTEGAGKGGMVFLVAKDPAMRQVAGSVGTSQINQDGSFKFSNLRPGEYWVIALDTNQFTPLDDPDLLAKLEPKAASVKLKANDTANVQVKIQPTPEQ